MMNTSANEQPFSQLQEVLLEFRAGKMRFEGKSVVPDTRKGLVRVGRGEEGLVHIQWLDRSLNVVEDDQIVFPEEAVFEKINQSSGRVYILKFHTDDRKFFYWMQEPNAEGDTLLCNSLNFYLNLEMPEDESEASLPIQIAEDVLEEDISSRAGNLVGPSMGAASSDVPSAGPVKMADLQRILSNIGGSSDEVLVDPEAGLGLGDILRPEFIRPFIQDLTVDQELASYLPEGQWTSEDIVELLQSPPFRQQLDTFTYVLRTGQVDLSQFGIDPSNYNGTVPSFLESLEDSVTKTKASDEPGQGSNDAMDEGQ